MMISTNLTVITLLLPHQSCNPNCASCKLDSGEDSHHQPHTEGILTLHRQEIGDRVLAVNVGGGASQVSSICFLHITDQE